MPCAVLRLPRNLASTETASYQLSPQPLWRAWMLTISDHREARPPPPADARAPPLPEFPAGASLRPACNPVVSQRSHIVQHRIDPRIEKVHNFVGMKGAVAALLPLGSQYVHLD